MKRKQPERLLFRVAKGSLVPGDGYTLKRLKERGYKVNDILLADLRKPRQPGFHRVAHRLGQLVVDNIEEFTGLDGHAALKRLQVEAKAECDEIPVVMTILGQKIKISHRIPRSLSYASMDEGQFREVMRTISNHIATEYWPDMTAEKIEEMAEMMPEAA